MTKKDDLPAMMFYVGDWLKAPDIQCLSYELKGIWFEMLCFMWESNERGYLKYTNEELARLLRLPEDLLKQKLEQLFKRGIYSVRETDGAIYSRRMVRDQEIREIRKKAGSLGGKQTFAKKFAQAKTQANSEDEYETEIVNEIKENKVMDNPKIVKQEYFVDMLPIDSKQDFIETWNEWVDFRREIKKKLTKSTAKKQITFLLNQPNPIKCINQSIQNGWQGLFEVVDKSKPKPIEHTGRVVTTKEDNDWKKVLAENEKKIKEQGIWDGKINI